jgi:hypothetical protein
MLLLVLIMGLPTGRWADRAHRQREAVAMIEEADGSVVYRHEVPAPGAGLVSQQTNDRLKMVALRRGSKWADDVWTLPQAAPRNRLMQWAGRRLGEDYVDDVVEAWIGPSGRMDEGALARITGLARLEMLNLNSTRVTDAGLAHLAGLRCLKSLTLFGTRITDDGLVHLRGLDRLEVLGIYYHGGSEITDAGLAHLKSLKRLRELSVGGPKITDSGLAELHGLGNLEMLWLTDAPNVTPEGIARLRRALPRLDIKPWRPR